MRQLLPVASAEVDLEAAYAVPADVPFHVRAGFISSADGAVTLDGRSGGLGNAADKQIFGLGRDLADVILVGAGTARAERYGAVRPTGERLARRRRHGLPDAPVLALVSQSLDFDLDSDLFPTDEPRTVVVTSGASDPVRRAAVSAHAEVLVCGEAAVDLALVLTALRDRGLRRVHCEGGARLFAGMAGAGLVDELCLTFAPLLAGPGSARIVTGPGWPAPTSCVLRHLLEDGGYLYARYDLTAQPGSSRSRYVRQPGRPRHGNASDAVVLRAVADSDDAALGVLMERAYAGTVDEELGDNSDGAVEIADWRASGAVPEASFVALDSGGETVSASLVSRSSDDTVWVGYVITAPRFKGRGLGTEVVAASLAVLDVAEPDTPVYAGVTDGNAPSERLLLALGFRWERRL